MSEPMFRSGPASPPPEVAEPAESRSNRKALYLVGGVVGALVLAGGAFLLLNGSSSSGDTGTVAGAGLIAKQPSTAEPAAPVVVQPATVSVSTRDPFAVLYTAPVAAASPAAPAAPAAGTTGGTTPTAPVVTTPTTPPVTLAVTSINTGAQVATISVNGKKYANTKVGATFGTYYTLYSVFNPQCVGLLYGDQNVPVCLSKPATVTP
ncbi:MAG: hypothetical protein ABI468_02915 [Candidatus Nanopelagicales bacterium]